MKKATFVVALLLGATPAFAQFGVGEITKRAGQAQKLSELSISEKEERDMGDSVSATVRSEFGVVQDAALTKYVSLVGNVLAKASKYFDRIPSQPAPPAVDMTEPPQTAEKRQTVDDPLAKLARVDIVWHTPPALAPDDDALTLLAGVCRR